MTNRSGSSGRARCSFLSHPVQTALLLFSCAAVLLLAFAYWFLWSNRESRGRAGGFTILQINDVYRIEGIEKRSRGGLARLRSLRTSLEAEDRPVLVLHAGDLLGPAVMSKFLHSRPMVAALNRLDGRPDRFDDRLIATFGNHEFDEKSPELLLARLLESDFRWVSTHLQYKPWGEEQSRPFGHWLDNVHEEILVDLDGVRVGLFGITIDDPERPWLDRTGEVDSAQRADRICQGIRRLKKQGAQVLIALTHQEMDADLALLKRFPDLDLVVGGHEHLAAREPAGRRFVTKADADAVTAYRIDVDVSSDGEVYAVPTLITLDSESEYTEDPDMAQFVEKMLKAFEDWYKGKYSQDLMAPVARARHELRGVEPAIRGEETALGNWLADVARAEMETDVALIPGGSIRLNDNVPAGGHLTNYHLEGIFYFDSKLVRFELTCNQLLDVLRNSVSRAEAAEGRFLQVSGLKVCYDRSLPAEERVRREDVWVWNPKAGYEPLCQRQQYTVTTLQYLCENGGNEGYEIFGKKGKGWQVASCDQGKPADTDPPSWREPPRWRELTERWLTANGGEAENAAGATVSEERPFPIIEQRVEGRIVKLRPTPPGEDPPSCPPPPDDVLRSAEA